MNSKIASISMATILLIGIGVGHPLQISAQEVGVGTGAEVKVEAGSEKKEEKKGEKGNSQNEQSSKDDNNSSETSEKEVNAKTESNMKIVVRVLADNDETTIKLESEGSVKTYVLNTTDRSKIISSIQSETGISEEQIISIWTFSQINNSNVKLGQNANAESKINAKASITAKEKTEARDRAMEIIAKLQQRIDGLEERFQTLMAKLEAGTYFGVVLDEEGNSEPVKTSYSMEFSGTATTTMMTATTTTAATTSSEQIQQQQEGDKDLSAKIFLESLTYRENQSKFKVTGGQIMISGNTYDVIFGKARASAGLAGEKDMMVIICHVLNVEDGYTTTMKLLVDSDTEFEGDFGSEPQPITVKMPQSKIASEWFLSGSGQIQTA